MSAKKKQEVPVSGQAAQQPEEQAPAPRKRRGLFNWIHFGFARLFCNLRFSLTLRIALHYAGRLLSTTFRTVLIVTVVFVIAQVPVAFRALDALEEMPPQEGNVYVSEQLAGLPVAHAYVMEQPIEDTIRGFGQKVKLAFSEWKTGREYRVLLYRDSLQGGIVAAFAVNDALYQYSLLFWTLICCDLLRAVGFLHRRNRLNRRVLKPISEMADAAATLSANNLSNRISIEGTKNELKDLATVINLMLDRIELSYNSQKQFVSDASHELRTPIAVIQGYASMLERWGKTDKEVLDEGITAISQETTAMKELVERLLFLARHDKKTLMLEMELFDPTEIMSAVHREAKLLSIAHDFELKLEAHAVVKGDKSMLKQLMRVLVDNAIKYTPPGGLISLGMRVQSNQCVLWVTDTGSGISAGELSRIFDRFYRSDKARKAQSSGHGLGLSIARIIVSAHGGKINVRSKEGVGTTFSVLLPISTEERA